MLVVAHAGLVAGRECSGPDPNLHDFACQWGKPVADQHRGARQGVGAATAGSASHAIHIHQRRGVVSNCLKGMDDGVSCGCGRSGSAGESYDRICGAVEQNAIAVRTAFSVDRFERRRSRSLANRRNRPLNVSLHRFRLTLAGLKSVAY